MGDQWAAARTIPGLFDAPAPAAPAAAPPPSEEPASELGGALPPPPGPVGLSCTAPFDKSWRCMKRILFTPFDAGKWFILGFSAWLSTLGEGGGGSANFNLGDLGGGQGLPFGGDKPPENFREFIEMVPAIVWIIAAATIVVSVVLMIVVLWVRSRGKFMLLDNVLRDRFEVVAPWRRFKQLGNSLFLWNLCYGLVTGLLVLLWLALVAFAVVIPCIRAETFLTETVPIIVIGSLLFIAMIIVFGYITRFVEDLVLPVMYRFDITVMAAWRHVLDMAKGNWGNLLLYGFFYFVLTIGATMVAQLVVLVTCCAAALPYLGAVILLPITVFFRAYSVEYLAQFGPEYDLFEMLAPKEE